MTAARLTAALGLAVTALAAGTVVAHAEPAPGPPPPPTIIGALQYGAPGYPPELGVQTVPQARSGVAIAADSLSPAPAAPAGPPAPAAPPDNGIAGVATASNGLVPIPLPPPG